MGEIKKITDKERYKLKKFIKDVEGRRGRGTELVSVYIPAGYDLNKIATHISEEQGTANNIKSKQTRDNVISALEKIIQHLKLFPQTPENGLVLFSGNVSEKEGQDDFQIWSIEPPVPLNQRLYKCDKEFMVEPLKEMVEDEESYAMIVIDRREGNIALLKGKTINYLVDMESNVPGKFRAGGQSAERFARNRELSARDFYKEVAKAAKDQLLHMQELRGILVGGPGPTKHEFIDEGYLTTELRQKVIAVRDLSYTGHFGLQELLEKCQDVLAEEGVIKEKKLMRKFFELLGKEPGKVTYGKDMCRKALEMGAVETLMISENVDEEEIDSFVELSEQFGTEVELVSLETSEGGQLKDIGDFAAILRYDAGDMMD